MRELYSITPHLHMSEAAVMCLLRTSGASNIYSSSYLIYSLEKRTDLGIYLCLWYCLEANIVRT